nr:probable secreted peptidase [Kibdelosporangium sp. MJ126-NF4]
MSAASPQASAAATMAGGSIVERTVTLITGDRVTVRTDAKGQRSAVVRNAKGREAKRIVRYDGPDGITVLPQDAMPLVQAGTVDRSLFNVTKLIEYGYHDAARRDLPLIVRASAGRGRSAADVVGQAGAQVTRQLASIGGQAVLAKKDGAFWSALTGGGQGRSLAAGVASVSLDGKKKLLLDKSVQQISAPTAWQAGYTGKGVTVAVLDSGYDSKHADLSGVVTESKDFTETGGVKDTKGHGTHVAATIAGRGTASSGQYKGVAPEAKLLVGKVCDSVDCGDSAIIAGMQWAVERGAKVVNLSLGGEEASDGTDAISQALDKLSKDHGTLFVVAGGNSGPNENTVGSPGAAASALTVGAVDRADRITSFSSRGGPVLKPDVTAPGADVTAARAEGTRAGLPAANPHYVVMSGTSMASPHVAGAAALLLQRHPDWKAGQLKGALMASAKPTADAGVYQQGTGRIDVAAAIGQAVLAETPSVSFGKAAWPHNDDTPISKPLVYRNTGTAPVTLRLGVDGAPADKLFQVNAREVTVAAGATGEVTVTADPKVSTPDGWLGAVVTATPVGGGAAVRTPLGLDKEVEQHDLKVKLIDQRGKPVPSTPVVVTNLRDRMQLQPDTGDDGTATVRLPIGDYTVGTFVSTPTGPETSTSTLVTEPRLRADKDQELVFDARKAVKVAMTLDRGTVKPGSIDIGTVVASAWGPHVIATTVDRYGDEYVLPTRRVRDTEMAWFTYSNWAEPRDESPVNYQLLYAEYGAIPDKPVFQVHDKDLMAVHTKYAQLVPGMPAATAHDGYLPGFGAMVSQRPSGLPQPFERTTFYSVGRHQWQPTLLLGEGEGKPGATITALPRTYAQPGTATERWNFGVFGPSLPQDPSAAGWTGRVGNELHFGVPLYADQGPDHFGAGPGPDSLTLWRDGRKIEQLDGGEADFLVPAEPADYRVATEAKGLRPGSRIQAEWTFRSQFVAGEQPRPLPVSVVRFAPDLTERNQAKAGQQLRVPVRVQRHQGTSGTLGELTVEASFDDGKTWRSVPVDGSGDERNVLVDHPAAAGFVSLRAVAEDQAGNSVTQTMIRAYEIVR